MPDRSEDSVRIGDTDEVEETINRVVSRAITHAIEEQRKSFDPGRYITFTQAVLGIIGSIVAFMVLGYGYVNSVQTQIELNRERSSKLEYQAQISIDDRHDIHARLDHFEATTGEINQRLARIDTKLDEIRARQNPKGTFQ